MATGGDYRLVSEEDWQNLNDALDHEQRMREMEAEAARRWQERAEAAEKRAERNPWAATWTYSDDPSGFNECRCDEPKPAGHWTSDREWESEPETCGCDPDSRILCDRHFREDFCESDPEPCDGCAGCSCAEDERDRRIANAVADELMERLRAFVL